MDQTKVAKTAQLPGYLIFRERFNLKYSDSSKQTGSDAFRTFSSSNWSEFVRTTCFCSKPDWAMFTAQARTKNTPQYRLRLARTVSRLTPSLASDEGITNVGVGGGAGPPSLINDGFVLASPHSDVTPLAAPSLSGSGRSAPLGGGLLFRTPPPREAEHIKKLMSALGSSKTSDLTCGTERVWEWKEGVRLSRGGGVNRRGH